MAVFGTRARPAQTGGAPLVICTAHGTGSHGGAASGRAPPSPRAMIYFQRQDDRRLGKELVEVHRIQHSVARYGARFLNKIYTASEQAYCLRKRNAAESWPRALRPKKPAPKRWAQA